MILRLLCVLYLERGSDILYCMNSATNRAILPQFDVFQSLDIKNDVALTHILKGTVSRDFRPSVFFSSNNPS
jgi:hypothetical protein